MRIPTLYLDTSVLGGYFDDEWKQPTQELWQQMESGQWRFVTSLVAAEELIEAPDRVRDLFNSTFEAADVLNITEEIDQLAATYVAQGVVTPKYEDDARHVAACTPGEGKLAVSVHFLSFLVKKGLGLTHSHIFYIIRLLVFSRVWFLNLTGSRNRPFSCLL